MGLPFNQGEDYWTNPVKIFNRQKYGWSKYSGGFYGLVKNEGFWYCQGCGKQQPEEMPRYLVSADKGMDKREWVSLCSVCKHIVGARKISYQKLIRIVRINL